MHSHTNACCCLSTCTSQPAMLHALACSSGLLHRRLSLQFAKRHGLLGKEGPPSGPDAGAQMQALAEGPLVRALKPERVAVRGRRDQKKSGTVGARG